MIEKDNVELDLEEPLSIQIEKPASTKLNNISIWVRRLLTLDETSNQKHYRPIFILFMSMLHIFIYLLTHINIIWKGTTFQSTLFELFKFYMPCMRPTVDDIRMRIVGCMPPRNNTTCYYDDKLKQMCLSFMYPYQLWRMITVNLIHTWWLHLLFNLLKQVLYGIPIERKYGTACVAVIYWVSDLGASFSFILTDKEKSSIGASGSLYGLMLFFVVDRIVAIQANRGQRIFIFTQLLLFMLLPGIPNILLIVILKLNVAHSAHAGGALVGFLFGISMFGSPYPWKDRTGRCKMICRYTAFIFLSFSISIAFIMFFHMKAPIVNSILRRL